MKIPSNLWSSLTSLSSAMGSCKKTEPIFWGVCVCVCVCGGGKPPFCLIYLTTQTTPKNLPRKQCARAIPVTWLGSGACQARPSRLNTNEWMNEWIWPLFRELMMRKCGVIPTYFARTAREHLKRSCQHFKTRALPRVQKYFPKMICLLKS